MKMEKKIEVQRAVTNILDNKSQVSAFICFDKAINLLHAGKYKQKYTKRS